MAEGSVKDQIKKLIDLQRVDSDIYKFNIELKEKPLLIQQLNDEFELEKKQLKDLEEKSKQSLVKRKERELALKEKEDTIAKTNGQLSLLKTNKEYTTKLAEIESIKADKSIIEEQILNLYEEFDVIMAEINVEKIKLQDKEKGFTSKKKEIEDQIRIAEDHLKVAQSERTQLTPGIDKNYLLRYEKILQNKEGVAIVPLRETTCGGCFMHATTQMVNVLKQQSDLVLCEMCARILYLEDQV